MATVRFGGYPMISHSNVGVGQGRAPRLAGATLSQPHQLLLGLHPNIQERRVKRGSIIAHEGDKADFLLLVLEGWIGLSKALYDGQTQLIDLLMPGDSALIAAVGASTSPYSAEALCEVRYLAFTEDMVNGSEPEAAELRRHIASAVAIRQARMAELLLRMGQGSAEMRISFALLELFLRLEAVGKTDGRKFHLPMNQKQIGQFAGLTNVHVCRTLRRFARNGVVKSGDHTDIEIVDIDALCDLADVNLDELRAEIVLQVQA